MIRIDVRHLSALRAASGAVELRELVQKAIELEFSTVPPYLTAMMSLRLDRNKQIWNILHSVVLDEMLHVVIGCNLLIALGGRPRIDSAQFLPVYPGPLPMAIHQDLKVGLEPFSVDLVQRTFMEIETPEHPIEFQSTDALRGHATIGEFYHALIRKLEGLGDAAFEGHTKQQFVDTRWFDSSRLFAIVDVATAVRAIGLVVREGEGTHASPIGEPGQLAHFYRFEQIVEGRQLVRDSQAEGGFSFSGPRIEFDPTGVWPIESNQKLRDLDPDSQAGRRARQFAYSFTKLLKALQETFSGNPQAFASAFALMFELKLAGQMLVATPAVFAGRPTGRNAGPAFEYLEVND